MTAAATKEKEKPHRERVLAQARASLKQGRFVVPVPQGRKGPMVKNWPSLRLTQKQLENSFGQRDNIGWILGEPSGNLIDVDLDCRETVALAKRFLPDTDRVHGREGRPSSHYWYTVTPVLRPAKFEDLDGRCLVEIRSTGQQTLIPPSIHPNGKKLKWEATGAPARVDGEILRTFVAKVAAGALFARHWPALGSRHDAGLALSGALLRGGWSKDEAVRFVGTIARVAGDEEWRAREQDVRTTAQRLAAGHTATGKPRLGAIVGEKVVARALEWLELSPSVDVQEVNQSGASVLSWPDPPERDAYYGLAGDLVDAIEPQSEADPAALLVQTLAVVGNVVGRGPHFVAEADRHGTNIFAVIVGVTAKGRKGSSLSQVKLAIQEVDAQWASARVLSGLSSGEGLIWAVRDPIERRDPVKKNGRVVDYESVIADHGVEDKRLLDLETEFASVLRIIGREGSTLSATIRQAWDSGELRILNKNSPAKATGAHISIVGHITRDELRRYLDSTEVGNGFANRFLWTCARRSKVLPEIKRLEVVDLIPLIDRLRKAVEFARTVREMKRDNKARDLWIKVYPELSEGRPGLLGAVTSRAEAQVMRLACIYALLDCSPLIRVQHLRAALALWRYSEASARYIFGESLGDPVADELLRALRRNQNGVTRTEIRDLFGRNRASQEIDRALGALVEYGLVRRERNEPDNGRPPERWFAVGLAEEKTAKSSK